jgi:uncharacterized protein (TIRG00374 family)
MLGMVLRPPWDDRMNRQRLLILVGALVSAVFLVLAFQGLHPEALLSSLKQVDIGGVLLATGLFLVSVVVISWRWQFLLNPIARVRLERLFQLVCIGYMGNNIYPLRAGEALRIVLLRRDEGVPLAPSATVTIVERVFDGVVMLSFILLGVSAGGVQNDVLNALTQVAMPLFALAVAVLLLVALMPRRAQALVERLTRFLPARLGGWISRLSSELLGGLAAFQNVGQLLGAALTSFGSWWVQGVVYWVLLLAFGIDQPFATALLLVGAVNLAGLIPASPGQIGVFEYFTVVVLQTAGVAQPQALSYALVTHAVIWLPATLAGLAYLFQRGLTLRSAQQIQQTAA